MRKIFKIIAHVILTIVMLTSFVMLFSQGAGGSVTLINIIALAGLLMSGWGLKELGTFEKKKNKII
jgi:hypothetical protein